MAAKKFPKSGAVNRVTATMSEEEIRFSGMKPAAGKDAKAPEARQEDPEPKMRRTSLVIDEDLYWRAKRYLGSESRRWKSLSDMMRALMDDALKAEGY